MTIGAIMRWFRSPHYAPAAIAARAAVNVATVIWGIVVLSRENALDAVRFPAYGTMLKLMPEDSWAVIAICFAGFGLVRLFIQAKPNWIAYVGYFLMMVFWNWFAISLLVDYVYPLPPATIAGVVVIAGYSVYAFVSNPKLPGASDGRHG